MSTTAKRHGLDIWQIRRELDKARQAHMKTVMAEYDKQHNEAMRALREECGASGHSWRFTHLGPLGDPWFACYMCGASKVEIEK